MQQRYRRALVVFGILSVPCLMLLMMLAAHGQAPRVRKITFVSKRDGNNEIYVMDANGRNPRRLTNNAAADRTPAWSPNGQRIAFTSDRDGKGLIEVYIMDADGNNPRKLTDLIGINTNPSWSPGGSKIVFQSSRDRNSEIYILDLDDKNTLNLTNSDDSDGMPSWSPDGHRIVFTRRED